MELGLILLIRYTALIYFLHSAPPAAVPGAVDLSVEDVSVLHEEFPLGAEDEDVVGCGCQHEEEHFELKAHTEEDSACNERQDTAVHGVLRERKARDGIRPGSNNSGNKSSHKLF